MCKRPAFLPGSITMLFIIFESEREATQLCRRPAIAKQRRTHAHAHVAGHPPDVPEDRASNRNASERERERERNNLDGH